MTTAIINGRRVDLPPNATDADVRRVGGIGPGRTLIRRSREGNFVVSRGSAVPGIDGAVFVDAPPRKKG